MAFAFWRASVLSERGGRQPQLSPYSVAIEELSLLVFHLGNAVIGTGDPLRRDKKKGNRTPCLERVVFTAVLLGSFFGLVEHPNRRLLIEAGQGVSKELLWDETFMQQSVLFDSVRNK